MVGKAGRNIIIMALSVFLTMGCAPLAGGDDKIINAGIPAQVDSLLATPHQPTVADVQLEWNEVANATSYNIYRSYSVRGDGFNFSTPYVTIPGDGIGKIIWIDTGTYADNNNYSWIVRAVGAGGEN